jgi:hypothetical protein
MLEFGAHQLCWLLLQALFKTARALPTTMTAALSAINAVFIPWPRNPKPPNRPGRKLIPAKMNTG